MPTTQQEISSLIWNAADDVFQWPSEAEVNSCYLALAKNSHI